MKRPPTHRLPTAIAALVALLISLPSSAQPPPDQHVETTAITALRAELDALRLEYQQKLELLEHRLAELEAGASAPAQPATSLADLRAAAREAAGDEVATQPTSTAPATGKERNLSLLNPEVSATGILLARSSGDSRDEFNLHATEIDIQSALDPFSRTRWVIGFGEEGVHVEEGYVTYSSLPGGLELMGGKFKQRFGALNRQHLHALPQSDYPLVYRVIFGDEGLTQTGLSFNWLLGKPWATANEITFEVTNGENEEAFSGEDFNDFSALLKIKSFWELTPATYFEWGLSGVTGETAWGGDSRIFGTDLTYHWQPPGRAKYREVLWRTEFLLSQRDNPLGLKQEAWGGYSYLQGLLRRNLYVGARYDRAEDPLSPDERQWSIVPYVTWWQSEFVRLRAQYSYLENETTGDSDDHFTLQLAWAAGPHKHETY